MGIWQKILEVLLSSLVGVVFVGILSLVWLIKQDGPEWLIQVIGVTIGVSGIVLYFWEAKKQRRPMRK